MLIRGPTPRILWPSVIWVLVGAETLTLLWFHVWFVPVERSLSGYVWQCAVPSGAGSRGPGVVAALTIVNVLAGVGLWVAFRSARRHEGRLAKATGASCLAGAVLLALVVWWAGRLEERCRPLEVRAVYELGADGEYEDRQLPADPSD